MSQTELAAITKALQLQIKHKEELFDFGMHNNKEFEEMKNLHLEIKALKHQLKMLLVKNDQLERSE